ncbi:MAG: hypothetical protein ABIA66_00630, partial [Candidatus Omnitrophota bacterium]
MAAIKIGVGVSTDMNPAQAVKSAFLQATENIYNRSEINLAIVFSTIEFSNTFTLKIIGNLLGSVPVIGASSAAIITNKGVFSHGLL